MQTKELLKSKRIREWVADVLKKPIEEIDKISDAYLELSPREQKILEHRFGLEDSVTHTLEETGKLFGVTRERVRQVEMKALEKLRKHIAYVD